MRTQQIITFLVFGILTLGCSAPPEEPPRNLVGVEKFPSVFLNGTVWNAKIIVDDFSPDNELFVVQNFVAYLDEQYEMLPDTSIQYKHVQKLYGQNAIFIGTCNQTPHNKFVNLFIDCLSMEDNIAVMRLVEKDDVTILEVVGKNFQNTEEAIGVLMAHEKFNLAGREIQVRGIGAEREVRITG